MECREVDNLLPEYSAEALPRQQMTRVREHLTGCEPCRREWARLQGALRLVEHLAPVSPPPGLWHGVYSQIEAGEGGARDRARASLADLLRRWWTGPVRAATAAGAAAVIALGLWISHGNGTTGTGSYPPVGVSDATSLSDPEMVAAVQQQMLASTGQLFADRAGLESVVLLMRQKRAERMR
jgi:Putative zinc-finger